MKVRIKFCKHGEMKFIGHLDIMRYFQKAVRRAGIDVSYTGGFNPHQVMSFAAPLGVGLESDGEYMDIAVESQRGSEDMLQRLNEVMVEGIRVLSVKALPDDAGNAMASVAAAGYLVRFREGAEPDFDYKAALEKFYEQPSIMVTKKTKKSMKEMNLKPFIYELKVTEEGIYMLVDASSSGNIKPRLVMEALYNTEGKELGEYALLITRTETYGKAGTDGERKWIPMEEFGENF